MIIGQPGSENYIILIKGKVNNKKTTIKAFLPDGDLFDLRFGNNWSPLINESTGTVMEKIITSASGYTFKNQALSALSWQGMDNFDISLTLEFVAHSSTKTDVLDPVTQLIQMALPYKGAHSFIHAPGPFFATSTNFSGKYINNTAVAGKGNNVSIRIGKFFFLSPVVIKDVGYVSESKFDKTGFPIATKLTVTFEPYFTPVVNDIPGIFNGGFG